MMGYGYMWWTRWGGFLPGVDVPAGTYAAMGNGGHCIVVVPTADVVVVHRVENDHAPRSVDMFQLGRLLHLLLEAAGLAARSS